MTSLVEIEGIAEHDADKLHGAGVATVEALLSLGATTGAPRGRGSAIGGLLARMLNEMIAQVSRDPPAARHSITGGVGGGRWSVPGYEQHYGR